MDNIYLINITVIFSLMLNIFLIGKEISISIENYDNLIVAIKSDKQVLFKILGICVFLTLIIILLIGSTLLFLKNKG